MQDFMSELKAMPIWFHWHWEQDKNGQQTKVPHAARGGATGTSEQWAHTWVTYDEALSLQEEHHASGLGFKVPNGYFFLDADHYGFEDPFIQLLLERFNSYTERSVSGGGIHIYGKCDVGKLPIVTDKNGNTAAAKAKIKVAASIILPIFSYSLKKKPVLVSTVKIS